MSKNIFKLMGLTMRGYEIVGAVVIMVAAGCSVLNAQEQTAVSQGGKTIETVRVNTPPVLDGKLDDACWQKVRPVTDFLSMDSDRMATYQSIGYVCYDDSHLYIGMKCLMPEGVAPGFEPGTSKEKKSRDSYLFSDDIVEIMLDPGHTQAEYYQLVVSAFGSVYDSYRKGGGTQNDPTWNGDWNSAAHIEDGYWSMEMSIPFYTLGISPGMDSTWGINLCRETKRPNDEYSSIAIQGAFSQAKKFAILKGLTIDFSKYFFQIGPNETRMDMQQNKPIAILSLPVKNMTGKTRDIEIDRWFIDSNEKESVESKVVTIGPKETVAFFSEQLEAETFLANHTDAYAILSVPKTKKIVVSDAKEKTILALSLVTRPWYCEAMRVDVDDPWRKESLADKSPFVSLKVHTLLSRESLEKGELVVTLTGGEALSSFRTSRETGKILVSKSVSNPNEITEFSFPTKDLPWGAYDVRAMFKDSTGKEMISSHALATVLPGGKHSIKVLNNLVSELVNAEERGLLAEKEIEFMNPRNGWVFFSISGTGMPGRVMLDSENKPLAVVWQLYSPAVEVMRLLPAGRHVLHMEGEFDHIVARSVPELVYSCHASPFDWEFLRKDVLSNCNTILGGTEDEYHMREWKEAGKKWFTFHTAPGHGTGGNAFVPADKYYEVLSTHQGFINPLMDGVFADQIGTSSAEQKIEIARTLSRMVDNAKFKGREYRPWYEGMSFGSEADKAFMNIVLGSGWPFSNYRYLSDSFSEKNVRDNIQELIVKPLLNADKAIPGSLRRVIMTLGYLSHMPMGESQDVNPGANFKVLMQMQMETLANDPALFGAYGLLWYYSSHVDEENLRWGGRLFRHYAIEGRTTKLTSDPYHLPHIQNPDFEQGTKDWSITQSEPGTVSVKAHTGYGNLQSRYLGGSMGDTFLVTKRSAKGPNKFSQEINALTPGRAYSMRMITADYGNIIGEKSVKQKDAISINLDNVEMITGSDKNYQWIYPSVPVHPLGKFSGEYHAYMNFHWHVFRAKGNKAKLTVSDWAKPGDPGGPIGQEIMYNFIEIQPYLE